MRTISYSGILLFTCSLLQSLILLSVENPSRDAMNIQGPFCKNDKTLTPAGQRFIQVIAQLYNDSQWAQQATDCTQLPRYSLSQVTINKIVLKAEELRTSHAETWAQVTALKPFASLLSCEKELLLEDVRKLLEQHNADLKKYIDESSKESSKKVTVSVSNNR